MKFDLEQAKIEFSKYVSAFDMNNKTIARKIGHSYRVMEISNKLACKMKWEKYKIEIATLIGLLHDIARFEQETKYRTMEDLKSIDHGNRGVEILQENNFIRKFIGETKYDHIILKAIKNHNKYKIEEGLTEEELKFAKLIRDSDKLDIFYEAIEMFFKEKEIVEEANLPKKTKECFKKKKTMLRKKDMVITPIVSMLNIVSFIFDINYIESFKIIQQEKYIDQMFKKFECENQDMKIEIENIKRQANTYIQEKIKEV